MLGRRKELHTTHQDPRKLREGFLLGQSHLPLRSKGPGQFAQVVFMLSPLGELGFRFGFGKSQLAAAGSLRMQAIPGIPHLPVWPLKPHFPYWKTPELGGRERYRSWSE